MIIFHSEAVYSFKENRMEISAFSSSNIKQKG